MVIAVSVALRFSFGEIKPLTPAQFAMKANALCREFRKDEHAIDLKELVAFGRHRTDDEAFHYGQRAIRFEKMLAEFRKLRAPRGEKLAATRIAVLANRQLLRFELLAKMRPFAAQENAIFFHTGAEYRESDNLARKLGMKKNCLEG